MPLVFWGQYALYLCYRVDCSFRNRLSKDFNGLVWMRIKLRVGLTVKTPTERKNNGTFETGLIDLSQNLGATKPLRNTTCP